MTDSATIFALSSGAPPAAIAIMRISGPSAFDAVEKLAKKLPPMRRPSLAKLYCPIDGNLLDEALVLLFSGPNSATGEDLAELHLHGGRAVVRAVAGALESISGLRQAVAGEFTRRAFINGRIDLNEAEGLSDLLAAESEWQRRAATQMMSGAFGTAIETWRTELLQISALVEAELDFSDEDDVDDQNRSFVSNRCIDLSKRIQTLLDTPDAVKLRDGLRIVLGGPPNAGKSTLLNALVARDAAIVSEIAGTTRDVIEVPISLSGIPIILMDTAGVHGESEDQIEQIGIERAQQAFASADMILWLGEEGLGPDHISLIEIDAKADIAERSNKSASALLVSAKSGEGMTRLITRIVEEAKDMLPPQDSFAINKRQRALLASAASAITESSNCDDWLIAGEQLRLARLALDALSGRAHTEDMLDTLFSRFCVGK